MFSNLSALKRVFAYAAPYRRRFVLSILLAVVLAAMAPIRPLLIQYTINTVIGKGLWNWLVWVTVLQIGILVVETALRFLFGYQTAWLGQTVVRDLRNEVYKKILGLNVRQFDKTPIGTLTTRTINDIESINDIFSEGLIPIIADVLSILAILGAMFYTNWQLTLVCLVPFPILILATYFFKESVNRSFIRVRNAVAALNAFVQEHVSGMSIVHAFAAENYEADKFQKINAEHRQANIRAIFAYSVFFPVVEIILASSTGLLVWYAGVQVMQLPPEKAVGLAGQILSFILLLNLLFRPLRVIADKFNVLQMGMIASERVFKIMDNDDEMPDSGTLTPERFRGEVEFRDVRFGYYQDQPVLKNINFGVEAGKTLALVGNTGSGKTTIISILNRLYEADSGDIRIDGVRIQDYRLHTLRRQIGVVLQDVFLFSGTVLENVTLRNPAISREQVEAAARVMGIHDFILRLPGGYDFQVMERGATLSLGQRQLLSFLRTLLYDPSILIMDEATSSIDPESEALIQLATEQLLKGRTSIVIAHRLSTIRKADSILVLDKGEVREKGSHEELLQLKGAYARLYELQFGQENR